MSVRTGVAAVTEFLERESIPYKVVEHERTQTAAAEARAAGVPAADVAKTIVLRDDEGLRLAVQRGDHEHAVLVNPRNVIRAGEARVADICVD